jgi:hypothetical protein
MKQAKFLLLMLCVLLGYTNVLAETVSPYTVDFNTNPGTSSHDFAVASSWGHIVPTSDYDGYGPYYMTYSYSAEEGIDGSGTLNAYKQYAGDNFGGEVVTDLLVTPVVSGKIELYVKANNLANTSYPSFVEFYTLNEAATAKVKQISSFTADQYTPSSIEGWSTVTINVSTPQRIGIRAQNVYLDNFSAASAEIVKSKKLTITGLTPAIGSTPYYVNQKADGSVDIELSVKLKNTGDVDLIAGETENFTLSPVKKEYYNSTVTEFNEITFDIPVDIPVGEEKTITMTATIPNMPTGWLYWKVKENISGTVSSLMVQSQVVEYASKFIFDKSGTSYYSSSSATRTPIDFGKATEDVTLNYEIYNAGSAPLVINSFTLSAPFTSDAPTGEFTVEGGEKKQIAITLPATEAGVFSGQLEIAYTNFGKEQATYTLGISGTIIDPSKNWITFDNGSNGAFPAGSIHSDQVYIAKQTVNDVDNYYLQSTSTTTKFITPLLTAEAGESFTFDVWYSSYSSTAAVLVYTSTDRVNWTQVANVTSSYISSSVKTSTVTIAEAGDYYIAFELKGNALIDNIYGLTLAETPGHDWYITEEATIPTKGKQNYDYTASIKVQNISAAEDVVETATLYMNGEAVATVENISMAGNDKTASVGTGRNNYSNIEDPTAIEFTFKPHNVGTFPTYIELKSGDTVIKTEITQVTIAEEKTESELAIGEQKTTGSNVPFYGTWADDNKGLSECDVLYTGATLSAFGLKANDKITAITFKGTPSSNKTFNSLTTDAWVSTEAAEAEFVAGGADKTEMQHVTLHNEETVNFVANETMDFTITLPNPIVWDGVSSIRIATNMNGHGTYLNINFPVDNTYSGAAYYSHGGGSWSGTYLPVAYLSLDVKEKTLSGQITDAETGDPIEGATVTIRNDVNDVEYTGTTNEEGNYTINVVQDQLSYTVTVEAEGYETYSTEEEVSFGNGSVDKSITMTPIIEVTISNSTYATLYYENKEFEIPEGVEAYTVTKDGNIIHMNQLTGHIPAGTPVVLHAEPGTYQLTTTDITPTTEIESDLVGSEEGGRYDESGYKYYILSWRSAEENVDEVGFYFQSGSAGKWAEVRAHQAFLRVPDDNASAAGYRLSFEEPTGIDSAKLAEANNSDAIYSISGARVNKGNLQKGIYIMNGKKVVIK